MRKEILLGLSLLTAASVMAEAPAGYYDKLEGKKRTELMAEIRALASGHTNISYGSGSWDAFRKTDAQFVNGRQAWIDMYSDEVVYTSEGHPGLNIEHCVPNSWWGGTKGLIYNDLFNLSPSNEKANQEKSNFPLAEVASVTWTNGVSTVGRPVMGQGGGSTYVFEPDDRYKGDFARMYFYMFVTYQSADWQRRYDYMFDLTSMTLLKPWAAKLLIAWNAADPVDDKERRRNDAIYKVQKNRNAFIDLPTLPDFIWGDKSHLPFSAGYGAVDGVVDDSDRKLEVAVSGGDILAPDGARVFDLSGRECPMRGLRPGIYIVTAPEGSVKISIR